MPNGREQWETNENVKEVLLYFPWLIMRGIKLFILISYDFVVFIPTSAARVVEIQDCKSKL
jgi:hypothetical protein